MERKKCKNCGCWEEYHVWFDNKSKKRDWKYGKCFSCGCRKFKCELENQNE